MVAMNPQTWDRDIAAIEPGGYLLYDSTRPVPASRFRSDITVIGIPLTEICNKRYPEPRLRQLFKNMVYLGARSALIDLDLATIDSLISEQFRGKEKLIEPNTQAVRMGRDWTLENVPCPLGLRLEQTDAVGDRIFIDGNAAAALGAI
jgi:2-oxoglutarate ferredoxin oxidoreductase subunit alpha